MTRSIPAKTACCILSALFTSAFSGCSASSGARPDGSVLTDGSAIGSGGVVTSGGVVGAGGTSASGGMTGRGGGAESGGSGGGNDGAAGTDGGGAAAGGSSAAIGGAGRGGSGGGGTVTGGGGTTNTGGGSRGGSGGGGTIGDGGLPDRLGDAAVSADVASLGGSDGGDGLGCPGEIKGSWVAMNSSGAPIGSSTPLLFWTGRELLLYANGQKNFGGATTPTQALYEPCSDSWRAADPPPLYTWEYVVQVEPAGALLFYSPILSNLSYLSKVDLSSGLSSTLSLDGAVLAGGAAVVSIGTGLLS